MRRTNGVLFSFLPVFLLWGLTFQSGQNDPNVLLVVPATKNAITLAVTVAEKRSVDIVSYEKAPDGSAFMNHWNPASRSWNRINIEGLTSSDGLAAWPELTVVLGPHSGIPRSLAGALSGQMNARHIDTLETTKVFNALDRVFHFSRSEWEYFSSRYNFALYDRNYERRKYGRYGPPPGVHPREQRDAVGDEDVIMEPLEVIRVEKPAPAARKKAVPAPAPVVISTPAAAPDPVTEKNPAPGALQATPDPEPASLPHEKGVPNAAPSAPVAVPAPTEDFKDLRPDTLSESPVLDLPGDSK